MAKARDVHNMTFEERKHYCYTLCDFKPGDIVVREGQAVIICNPNNILRDHDVDDNTVPICNLANGATWFANMDDEVFPAFDVRLSFRSNRK